MPIKKYRPTSPGRRFMSVSAFDEVTTTKKPEKRLLVSLKTDAGRNAQGKLTVRHQGGGHRKLYRIIDFKRNKLNIPATVSAVEYDPNRSARIALLTYADGEKRYILAPVGLTVGDKVISGPEADIKPGNALPLASIPLGSTVHNIELNPGKAGKSRWRGKRPAVRGVTMNPFDHPHGGGEGRSGPGGNPKTPWGKPALGYRTRRNKKTKNMLVRRRPPKRKSKG